MKLKKRKVCFNFSHSLSPWLTEKPFTRNFLYAYTFLVPDSERFIIRATIKHRSTLISHLNDQVGLLFYQEGQHAREHEKANRWIEEQGYKLKFFSKVIYYSTYWILEHVFCNKLLLSIAAATEHLNTTLAEYFLKNPKFFSHCPPLLAGIYNWHFAEEIEHKEVVYDVFNAVSGSYFLRIIGALVGALGFLVILPLGAFICGLQDLTILRFKFWKDLLTQLVRKDNLTYHLVTSMYCY